MSLSPEDFQFAEVIWNYMFLKQEPIKSDVIIGLRHHVHNTGFDEAVAEDAAQLYLKGYAPLIVFSGGNTQVLKNSHKTTHANSMKIKAMQMGVPEAAIVIEDASTNSGNDISQTQRLLDSQGIACDTIILVHKPYMLRRDYATFMRQWLGANTTKITCWASRITLQDYLDRDELQDKEIIAIMIGDLHRIIEYPKRGFQIELAVPEGVLIAFDHLSKNGYGGHLVR